VAAKLLLVLGVLACLAVAAHKFLLSPAADATASVSSVPGVASVGTGGVVHLAGPDLVSGRPVDLDAYAGRPLVINVWASWCEPCRVEGPELAKFEHARPDVLVIGLDMQDAPGAALQAMHEWGWNHASIRDPEGRLYFALPRHDGIPMTLFLDAEHRVVDTHLSNIYADQLEAGAKRITGRT
jgi:thiol-disulfide isomerase/thioredoxin